MLYASYNLTFYGNTMADEIDLANEQAERWLAKALAAASQNTSKMPPKGSCYYCEAEFDSSDPDASRKLFCDGECAKDYETEQRLKNRR
jgi:hypothetical protein